MEDWDEKLITAARNGDIEALKLCLQNDADIDYPGRVGWTALMIAAYRGHLEICKLLIDRGCKIDITNVYGETALMSAAREGHLEVCKLLIDTGCKIDITERDGWTALMFAAREGHLEICKLLIDRGCKIDTTDEDGWTALMSAAREGHLEICRLLIDTGCKIDITNEDGWTALMFAAREGHLEVCKLLIDTGCKIDITTRDGRTALHYAAGEGHLQTTRYLVERGASPLIKSHQGKTPYDLAAAEQKRQYKEVMEYLQSVMSEKYSGVTAGQGIEDDVVPTETKLMADQKSIDLYLELLKSGYESKRDIRLVVLGKKGAGKTSLIRRLFGEDITDVTSTNGIEIHKIKCKALSDDGIWTKLDENYEETQTQARLFKEYVEKLQDKRTSQEPEESHIAIKNNTPVIYVDESKKSSKKPEISKPPEVNEPRSEHPVTPKKSNQSSEQAARDFESMLTAKSKVDVNDKEEYATFMLWDFAGDEEFYHTHQTFLSQDAIYLVVTKLNEADDRNAQALFRLWIDSIHCYSRLGENITSDNDPPVVIVGTWKDAVTLETDTIEIACREILLKYINELGDDERGHVRCEYSISNKDDDHSVFQQIRKQILNVAREMRTWNIKYPLKFIQLEQELQKKKEELPIISYDAIKAISSNTPMPLSEEELQLYLAFHHELRSLVYLKDLPDYIILDTQWLSDAFKCIVTAKKFQAGIKNQKRWNEFYHTGKLNYDVLEDIFKKKTTILYEHKDYILNVMEKFDIIIGPNKSGADENPYYYVPCMIRAEPESDIYEMFNVPNDIRKRSTWLCFRFMFLPPHLMNHLIASLTRKYTVAEVVDSKKKNRQIALFKGTAVFELQDATKCRKLLVMTCPNVIQIQVWELGNDIIKGLYKNIADFVTEELNTIMHTRFKMSNVKFEKTWECGLTEPKWVTGSNKFMEETITEYQCDTCQIKHMFIDEWSDQHKKAPWEMSILTKLSQMNSEDFNDLVAQGTFASYENRVFLAGPCNTGKSSLASILIDETIPEEWISTDGLVIHFGRNGIDLEHRKMVPLKGSGDIVTKVLLGNPKVKEQEKVKNELQKMQNNDKNDDKVKEVPLSNQFEKGIESTKTKKIDKFPITHQHQKRNVIYGQIPSDGEQHKKPTTISVTSKHKQKPKPTIQEYIKEKMKKGSYTMNTAPSDLVDFGGQRSFDMTHQLFIQHRGTFILMFDGRFGLDTRLKEYPGNFTAASILEHWITSILTYCRTSPDKMPRILFAATHSDSFNKDKQKNLTQQFEHTLTKLFSPHKLHEHIVYDKVFFINAKDAADVVIGRLKETLVKIAYEQSTWGQPMPIVWVPLDLQISDMRADGVALITKERLLDINKSNNEFALSDERVEIFLLVQHSIGKLLYFNEPTLRDFIVVQPTAMVNILRAFITDKLFWPKEAPFRDILEKLSFTGMLKKTDLFTLWSQNAFKDIFKDTKTKDYIVQVLLHLDILVEPNRYIEKDIEANLYFVPCIVKENMPEEMEKRATDDKTMVLAYNLNETVVPSTLSFKLIGAAINIWPLIVSDKRRCLYFQAAILDAGDKNTLQIRVEGQRIIIYLINEVSKQSISSELATRTQECLTLALERILKFYCRSMGEQRYDDMSELFQIEVGEVCKGKICFIPLLKAKGLLEWNCKNGITHKTEHPKNWAIGKSKTHCDANCEGFKPKPGQTLENHHMVKLARTITIDNFKKLYIGLGMTEKDYSDLNSRYTSNPMEVILIGLFKWKNRIESNLLTATIENLVSSLKCIEGQHYLCQKHEEDYTLSDYQYLQDAPSDDSINALTEGRLIGDCAVHLGFELGLSYEYIVEILHNYRNDLKLQFCELLKTWLNNQSMNTVKPTIYGLMVALQHVDAAKGLRYLINTYGLKPDNKLNVEHTCQNTKLDFSDILDQMMTKLVISVDDRRTIEQNTDQENTMLDIVIKRGEPNKSLCIDVLLQNSGYKDLVQKLKSDSSSSVPTPTKTELQDVPDYKIRLQKNYLAIINKLKHNDK